MQLQTADLITARPVSWLWNGRLARGKLAILDGDPGLGKSLFALDLCARLTTGRPLPDGSPGTDIANAIYLNAEDGTRDTIQPRLRALGADLKRVFLMDMQDASADLLRLPGQTAQLEDALKRTEARLVVLDPVIAFLDSSVSDASNQSIRRALLPLAVLAEKYDAVILLIRHLNKRMGGRAIYRGTGSIGFLGACRSGWLLGLDPADPSRRVLAQLKNNLAPPQPSLAFTMNPRDDGTTDLCWLGETPLSAEQLLEARPSTSAQPERKKAERFLKEFLKDGPRSSRDIWEAALKQGLTSRTLFRARSALDIQVGRKYQGHKHTKYWSLPQHDPTPPDTEPSETPELDALLAAMRKEYPPATPLDEYDDD
jgi:hypothetical protein